MPVATTKEERLHIRVSDRQKQLLSEAARARHVSTSQFVIQASLDAAGKVVADQTAITLSPEQWESFQQRLDEPPKSIPALRELFRRPEPF